MSLFEVFACQAESTTNSFLGTVETRSCERVGGLELKRDGGEALGKGIVNLACQAVTFFDSNQTCCGLRMFRGETGALNGKADLVANDMLPLHISRFEFATVLSCNIHSADWTFSCYARHYGVVT